MYVINMPSDEFIKLSEKIKNGSATAEEKLSFLKELNASLEFVRKNLPDLKNKQKQ